MSGFKSYFLRRTFELFLNETEGQDKTTKQELTKWTLFPIRGRRLSHFALVVFGEKYDPNVFNEYGLQKFTINQLFIMKFLI